MCLLNAVAIMGNGDVTVDNVVSLATDMKDFILGAEKLPEDEAPEPEDEDVKPVLRGAYL